MKILLRWFLAVLALGLVVRRACAASEAEDIAAVTAADNERVAAILAGDAERLGALLSDDLRYAHSSGHIDTKATALAATASHRTVHERHEYLERKFTEVAPGVVLMTGRVIFHERSGGQPQVLDLNFLAVWRNEGGHWRFLAWQSCKNPMESK